MLVPEELIRLTDTGVALIVGTSDGRNVPELCRGWGVRVLSDRLQLEVCVPLGSGARVLANIVETGNIAITLVQPTTYRSFQVKGRAQVVGEPSAGDLERVSRHQQRFIEEVAAIGMAGPEAARLFDSESVPGMSVIRMTVESLFDQTPGPGAGARL